MRMDESTLGRPQWFGRVMSSMVWRLVWRLQLVQQPTLEDMCLLDLSTVQLSCGWPSQCTSCTSCSSIHTADWQHGEH